MTRIGRKTKGPKYERAEIIERALEIYLSKRRVKQIDVVEPPPKARRMEATLHVLDSSDEELEDDEDELHVNIAKCFIK